MTPPACRLYLITPPAIDDLAAFGRSLGEALEAGDVGALQLRLKDAPDDIDRGRRALCCGRWPPARDVPLILNDRPDLAARLGCDGVHVGQTDAPYAEARRIMGKDRIVGVTCHDSRHLAMEASEAGADYVAFGAFFPTATKDATTRAGPGDPGGPARNDARCPLRRHRRRQLENCRPLVAAGADFLAVSAGVWTHPDGPAAAVAAFNAEISSGLAERG